MTLAGKTRLSALAVALLAAALLMPLTPASANDDVAVITVAGTAHLSDGIGSSNNERGCFGGVNTGVGSNPTVFGGGAFATFTYNNPDSIEGDATGTITIEAVVGSDHTVGFDWERTGVVAIVDIDNGDGIAVAGFAPVDVDVFDCAPGVHANWGEGSGDHDPTDPNVIHHAQVTAVAAFPAP